MQDNATDSLEIVLASASSRRQELLHLLGLTFQTCTTGIAESLLANETAEHMALRLSETKARAANCGEACLSIGADTSVVLDGRVLGKPVDAQEARLMLRCLRDKEHQVITGVCIIDGRHGLISRQLVRTFVHMRAYSEAELDDYIRSGDPFDKAGAYAVQNGIFKPVDQFRGCYTNIIGLPLCHVYRVLRQVGIPVAVHPLTCCPWAVKNGCDLALDILAEPILFDSIDSYKAN